MKVFEGTMDEQELDLINLYKPNFMSTLIGVDAWYTFVHVHHHGGTSPVPKHQYGWFNQWIQDGTFKLVQSEDLCTAEGGW